MHIISLYVHQIHGSFSQYVNIIFMKHIFESNKEHIIENSMYHEQFDDDDLLNNMGNLAQTKEKNQVFRKCDSPPPRQKWCVSMTRRNQWEVLGKGSQPNLIWTMYLSSLPTFFGPWPFIAPFSYWLWIRGVTQLWVRQILAKIGLICPKCDYEALVAIMCLEQTQAIFEGL